MNKTKIIQSSSQYKKDRRFGIQYEKLLLEYLNKNNTHDEKIIQRTEQHAQIDYYSKNWEIELKTRRCYKNSYPDLMMGKNKLTIAEKTHKNTRFYWIFKDGVYYWDFEPNPENDDEEIKYYFKNGGRTDRGVDERKLLGYVFTDNLKLLTTDIKSH